MSKEENVENKLPENTTKELSTSASEGTLNLPESKTQTDIEIENENKKLTQETSVEEQTSHNPTEQSNISNNDVSGSNNEIVENRENSKSESIDKPQTTEALQQDMNRTGSQTKNDNDSGTSPAKMDSNCTHENEDDMDEYDPDLYITDEEKRAFEYMLDKRRDEILQQRDNFKKWVESITRRRMFALSRLRKINQCHQKRMQFYDNIGNYVKTADNVINSSDNSPTPSSDKEPSQSMFENMIRENTGFIINQPESPMKKDTSDYISEDGNKTDMHKSNTPNNNEKSVTNSNVTSPDGAVDNISKNNDNTPKIVPVQS